MDGSTNKTLVSLGHVDNGFAGQGISIKQTCRKQIFSDSKQETARADKVSQEHRSDLATSHHRAYPSNIYIVQTMIQSSSISISFLLASCSRSSLFCTFPSIAGREDSPFPAAVVHFTLAGVMRTYTIGGRGSFDGFRID